jgi:acyl-CoA synthetase (AMP-forming)/AMP-acid ligase II
MSEEEAFRFCEGLPRYKSPRRIIFDEVPRNPTGKIEKPKLRKSMQVWLKASSVVIHPTLTINDRRKKCTNC